MAERLITPDRMSGADLDDLLQQHWDTMSRTRQAAQDERQVLAGEDRFVLPEDLVLAGAEHYVAEIPHPYTVPQRVRQKLIASRPSLNIPLGPKGLGITAQRQTTRVEEPLNAICEDDRAGFAWEDAADILLFEGWCAGITVVDPADWLKHPSPWDDENERVWKKRYRVNGKGQPAEDDDEVDDARARRMAESDLATFRARNVPIRHRSISIMDCAPIFGRDPRVVEGLLVVQEYSLGYLKRRYHFEAHDLGLATITGRNNQTDGENLTSPNGGQRTISLIEAWLYDDEGVPYVSYAIRGANNRTVEARWKTRDQYDGDIATIDLHERFGLERLPVAWSWGLGTSDRNPDRRALPFTRPFSQGWRSVRAKLTSINIHVANRAYPILLEEDPIGAQAADAGLDAVDETPIELKQMGITKVRGKITELGTQGISNDVYKAIDLELGSIESEAPGKSNKDQSGFSQSMAEAFEAMALTTVRQGLAKLYEAHGSFVLEAGKRLPEVGKRNGGSGYAPIMVFRSTDVPVSENPGNGDRHEPMELDPDLIDETFTVKATYEKSMSIPERQQSMEEVERRLKTRRKHLEDVGDNAPETTELELIAEDQRSTPEYQKYLMGLVAQVQGAEELEQIAQGQDEGVMNGDGLAAALGMGVQPPMMLPPGMPPGPQMGMPAPQMPGAMVPGVPMDGSVTGFGGPTSGQAALAGTVGGGAMTGPINRAAAAGGAIPADLPIPQQGGF